MNLYGRSLLKDVDLAPGEFVFLLDEAALLRAQKRRGIYGNRLAGRNIALIFEKASTGTRAAFEVAAHDEGAHVTYFGPTESQLDYKESMADTARVLGRMFDGIEYRGFSQDAADALGRFAGVPVWNGLTELWHPTQMLADMLTMRDHVAKPFNRISYCYLGDARNNTANSLLVTGAMLGLDVRICAPRELFPSPLVQQTARDCAAKSNACITVTTDLAGAVRGVDFLYTDVWLSMGERPDEWDWRIDQLLPYQVNSDVIAATGNPAVKFMHCLPALHDRETQLGREIYEKRGLDALEVTEDVFESPRSIVFDQAENRLHTIKAIMISTIPPRS